jgi:hypothetical protein
VNSDALAYLASKGLSLDEIIEFSRLSERKKDPTNAERQARHRERKKSGSVTRYSNGVIPPIDNIHTPQPVSNETVKTARGLAHKLPDDWKPVLTAAAQRMVDGWPPGKFADEVAAFRDHAADKGRKSKDWQAAFRTWITNANRWSRNDKPTGIQRTSQPSGGQRSALARALDAADAHLGSGSQTQIY